jgi:hypothetical protein
MIKSVAGGMVVAAVVLALVADFAQANDLPPYPRPRPEQEPVKQPDPEARERQLFRYAHRENRLLKWDSCLAEKARRRARQMAREGYLDHRDPKTGENEAWDMIAECDRFRFGGENLVKGAGSSLKIHRALMNSAAHRKNLLDQRFNRIGIGCVESVCVQFFAGE